MSAPIYHHMTTQTGGRGLPRRYTPMRLPFVSLVCIRYRSRTVCGELQRRGVPGCTLGQVACTCLTGRPLPPPTLLVHGPPATWPRPSLRPWSADGCPSGVTGVGPSDVLVETAAVLAVTPATAANSADEIRRFLFAAAVRNTLLTVSHRPRFVSHPVTSVFLSPMSLHYDLIPGRTGSGTQPYYIITHTY